MEEQEEKRVRRAVQTTGLPIVHHQRWNIFRGRPLEGEIDIQAIYQFTEFLCLGFFLKFPDIHF